MKRALKTKNLGVAVCKKVCYDAPKTIYMKRAATYTPQETAEIAGVTRRTVYEWLTSGRLPAFKRGPKLWIIYHEVLEAFLAGRNAQKVFERIQGKEGVLHVSPRSSLAPVALDRKPPRAKRASVTVRQLTIDDTPQPQTVQGVFDPDKGFPDSWPMPEDEMPSGLGEAEQYIFRMKQEMVAQHRLKASGDYIEPVDDSSPSIRSQRAVSLGNSRSANVTPWRLRAGNNKKKRR